MKVSWRYRNLYTDDKTYVNDSATILDQCRSIEKYCVRESQTREKAKRGSTGHVPLLLSVTNNSVVGFGVSVVNSVTYYIQGGFPLLKVPMGNEAHCPF